MDPTLMEDWWPLHLRVARGETLTEAEQTAYERVRDQHRHDERFPLANEPLDKLRGRIAALNADQRQLQARQEALRAEIGTIEAALFGQTFNSSALGGSRCGSPTAG